MGNSIGGRLDYGSNRGKLGMWGLGCVGVYEGMDSIMDPPRYGV